MAQTLPFRCRYCSHSDESQAQANQHFQRKHSVHVEKKNKKKELERKAKEEAALLELELANKKKNKVFKKPQKCPDCSKHFGKGEDPQRSRTRQKDGNFQQKPSCMLPFAEMPTKRVLQQKGGLESDTINSYFHSFSFR